MGDDCCILLTTPPWDQPQPDMCPEAPHTSAQDFCSFIPVAGNAKRIKMPQESKSPQEEV